MVDLMSDCHKLMVQNHLQLTAKIGSNLGANQQHGFDRDSDSRDPSADERRKIEEQMEQFKKDIEVALKVIEDAQNGDKEAQDLLIQYFDARTKGQIKAIAKTVLKIKAIVRSGEFTFRIYSNSYLNRRVAEERQKGLVIKKSDIRAGRAGKTIVLNAIILNRKSSQSGIYAHEFAHYANKSDFSFGPDKSLYSYGREGAIAYGEHTGRGFSSTASTASAFGCFIGMAKSGC